MPPTEPGDQTRVGVRGQRSECARLGKSVTLGEVPAPHNPQARGGRRKKGCREQADWGTLAASGTAVPAQAPCVPASGPAAHVTDCGLPRYLMPHNTGVTGTPLPQLALCATVLCC